MYSLIFAILGVGGILVLAEMLWREGLIPRSKSRVTVHILVACWIAFWPAYLNTYQIIAVAIAMFIVVSFSRIFRIFEAIHRTKRWTIGEFLYPVAIGLAAYLSPEAIIFSAAILQLGLADGLASLIGSKLNFKPYKILGQSKTVGGSAVFFLISFAITLFALLQLDRSGLGYIAVLLLVPVLSTASENISVFGLDDITVPMISIVLLSAIL